MADKPEIFCVPGGVPGYVVRYAGYEPENPKYSRYLVTVAYGEDSLLYRFETGRKVLAKLIVGLFQSPICPEQLVGAFLKNYRITDTGYIDLDELVPGGVPAYSEKALATAEQLFDMEVRHDGYRR